MSSTIAPDGTLIWSHNNRLHRSGDLPAVIAPDGSCEWWFRGKLHRENDLPAIRRADGVREWWKNGVRYFVWEHMPKRDIIRSTTCALSAAEIPQETPVGACLECHSAFILSHLQTWLTGSHACPNCSAPWTNYTKYS